MATFYGMDARTVGSLTLNQLYGYMDNIKYVLTDSKEFMKPPPVRLPVLPITRYAERCGVAVPFDVHLDLIKNGVDDDDE